VAGLAAALPPAALPPAIRPRIWWRSEAAEALSRADDRHRVAFAGTAAESFDRTAY
jgi:hypothetical protein